MASSRCPVCLLTVDASATRCSTCNTAQHEACFETTGGCVVAGCDGKIDRPRPAAPPPVWTAPASPSGLPPPPPKRDMMARLRDSARLAWTLAPHALEFLALPVLAGLLVAVTNSHPVACGVGVVSIAITWVLISGSMIVMALDEEARTWPASRLARQAVIAWVRSNLALFGMAFVCAWPSMLGMGLIAAGMHFRSWVLGLAGFALFCAGFCWFAYQAVMLSLSWVAVADTRDPRSGSPFSRSRTLVWQAPMEVFASMFLMGIVGHSMGQIMAVIGAVVAHVSALAGTVSVGLQVAILLFVNIGWSTCFYVLQYRDLAAREGTDGAVS